MRRAGMTAIRWTASVVVVAAIVVTVLALTGSAPRAAGTVPRRTAGAQLVANPVPAVPRAAVPGAGACEISSASGATGTCGSTPCVEFVTDTVTAAPPGHLVLGSRCPTTATGRVPGSRGPQLVPRPTSPRARSSRHQTGH